jgi:hypothetical protein
MKNTRKTVLAVLAIGLLGCGLFSQRAQAVPINGYINFTGGVRFDTNSLATATRVKRWNHSIVLGTATTGDFAAHTFNHENVTMTGNWTFNSGFHPALWSVGGFTFDLTSSTILHQDAFFLHVTGVGIVSGNGFTPTQGVWDFTVTKSDGRTTTNFGFQAQTTTVPDGGSAVALLGIALVGVEALRRKLKAT